VLLVALVALLAYAAFAHGAARQPGEAWLEAALAALALAAAASALFGRAGRLRAPRAAWWGVGLLALFAAWSGISLAWSIAPDRTGEELNRAIAYALAAGIAIAIGTSVPRAIERFAAGWLLVATAVALYALGGKVVPGLHLHPLFDLDHTNAVARLRAPLEYWNALALVCALGVPVALRVATDATRRDRTRLAAMLDAYVLLLVVGLTYSRGGILAVLVAGAVVTIAGAPRLRGLLTLALAGAATAIPLALAFTRTGLKANGAPLAMRIHEGRILGAAVLACGLVLLGAGIAALHAERRIGWTRTRHRRAWQVLGAVAVLAVVLAVAGLAASSRGLTGSVSHAVDDFTTVKENSQFDPVRLVSTNSGNRWVWWKEAAGAWSDRPLAGWGAGSFALLHKRYRTDQLPVTQAHSVPLQALAETGLIGALLLYGALAALLAGALARLTALPAGRERDLAGALVAAAVAWVVHGAYDWDWNIPAVTLPALAMLAVVAARPRTPATTTTLPVRDEARIAGRELGLAAATVAAAAVLVSAALPAFADSKADGAANEAAAATPAALESAAARAGLASRLDPLAVRPLFVAAAIEEGRGRLLTARADLLEAADRNPQDPDVWLRLAGLALRLADRDGFARAAQRALALDPANPQAVLLAARAVAAQAPPASSATAVGTRLPQTTAP
jgi:O-Antigen ligase